MYTYKTVGSKHKQTYTSYNDILHRSFYLRHADVYDCFSCSLVNYVL